MIAEIYGVIRIWCHSVMGVASILLLCQSRCAADTQEVMSSIERLSHAYVEILIDEVRSSALQTSPVARKYRINAIRQGDSWGFQKLEIDREPVLRLNALYREGEGVCFNSTYTEGTESGESPVTGRYLSPTVSGTLEHFERVWPSDGNLDLFCFGILNGKSLGGDSEFLQTSRCVELPDDQIEVQSESRFGDLTMRCRAKDGFLPYQILLIQRPEHIARGRLISSIDMAAGNVWPAGKISQISWEVNAAVGYAKQGEESIPYLNKWTVVKLTRCESGTVVSEESKCTVTSLKLGQTYSRDEMLFGLKIPAGTPLRAEGASHLSFVWSGNWAIPLSDQLRKTNIPHKPNNVRLLLVTNLIVIAGIGVVFAWLKLRTSTRKQ